MTPRSMQARGASEGIRVATIKKAGPSLGKARPMHWPSASTLASGQTWLRWCDWLSIRSSGLGRSSRGLGGSRGSLGRHAFRDHAAAFAVAAGAAAADDLATGNLTAAARAAALNSSRLTTAARAAAFDGSRLTTAARRTGRSSSSSLTAARLTSRSGSSFAVATVLLVAEETAVAALLLVGKQTAVAAGTAMAAVASNGTRVTADEGDGNESNEHGETESENTLHHIPPDGNIERGVRSLKPSRNNPDPGRPPDRRKPSEQRDHPGHKRESGNRQHCPARAAGWGNSPA
jgi:hypothetical protein